MSHAKESSGAILSESHFDGIAATQVKKKNQSNNFMEKARTTVQDHLRFMDQSSMNHNSELGADEQQ